MTTFDVRDWAGIVGRAMLVMPDGDAYSLMKEAYDKIRERQPDLLWKDWQALVFEWTAP